MSSSSTGKSSNSPVDNCSTRVRDAIDRSDSANDYPAWKSEALIVDMINALILIERE